MSSDYVPEGCPLSPWEDDADDLPVCPACGAPICPGVPHIYCQ